MTVLFLPKLLGKCVCVPCWSSQIMTYYGHNTFGMGSVHVVVTAGHRSYPDASRKHWLSMAPEHQLLDLPLQWRGMWTCIADSVSTSLPGAGVCCSNAVKQVGTPLDAVPLSTQCLRWMLFTLSPINFLCSAFLSLTVGSGMGETVRAQLPIILSLLFLFFEAEMASDCPRLILLSFQVLMEMKGFRSSYKLGGLL